ncbi:MAG: DUF885 domain-containing protein [Sphingobacterium sp.]|jgi:uncharacterized protein (DUF885 family)|nr:DUF885 domain-containing protein [Sphingobacterium sp.]
MKEIRQGIILCLIAIFFLNTSYAQQLDVKLHRLFEKYYEKECYFNPFQATADGIHTYDDQLQIEGSSDFISAKKQFYETFLKDLKKFDRSQLTESDKISYDILEYTLKINLEGLALHLEYLPFNQFTAALPTDLALFGSGSGPQPFNTAADYVNWSRRLIQFKAWTDTTIANFEKGKKKGVVLPRDLVEKMIPQLSALAERDTSKSVFYEPIRRLPRDFSDREKKHIKTLYAKIIPAQVVSSYERLAQYLTEDYLPFAQEAPGLNALAGGDSIYRYFIKVYTTSSGITGDQIYQTGLREVDRITKEMEQNKMETGFKGTLQEYFHFLRSDKQFRPFKTPDEVLNAYRAIHQKIQPNLKALFNEEPKTKFTIKRVDPFQEASMGGPFYIKGNIKENRPATFFVPIPDATKISTVFYGLECTFIHEAIPGHHYQISLQQEQNGIPSFQQQNALYAYLEGWALYCESLGEALGCYTDRYQKMGALNNEIHRAIRLVVDVGIHTGKLTKREAVAYMMAHESIDEKIAIAEVERYMAWPGQALSYKIGELKIKELRKKYQTIQGDHFDIPAFHNAILKYGCMPLDVLENYMDMWNKETVHAD